MSTEMTFDGVVYISSKRAAQLFGYTQDYIGQLARGSKIDCRRVGNMWYVREDSLKAHKDQADMYVPTPPAIRETEAAAESFVGLDGKTYVSAARAAKLTGYHQDYIGQLARAGKILSEQVGKRWYVHLDTLNEHKAEKDRLLAIVQAEAVGIRKPMPAEAPVADVIEGTPESVAEEKDLHFKYVPESAPLIPSLESDVPVVTSTKYHEEVSNDVIAERNDVLNKESNEDMHIIPIKVLRTPDISEIAYEESNAREKIRVPAISKKYGVIAATALTVVIVFSMNISFFSNSSVFAGIGKSALKDTQTAASAITSGGIKGFATQINAILAKDLDFSANQK